MSEITLSKAVRTNLLSLQNTASLLGKSQERLSSGRRVNSALDNPTNFFTAQGLNSRASDLGQLADAVSNAVQTVSAADKGISAITRLVESAQATARQALQTAATISGSATTVNAEATVTGNVNVGTDIAATTSGNVDLTGDLTNHLSAGTSLSITIGSVTKVIGFNNTGIPDIGQDAAVNLTNQNASHLLNAINGAFGAAVAQLDGGTYGLKITAANATDSISIGGSAKAAISGVGGLADASPTNAVIGALSGTLTIANNTLEFGAGHITNRAQLATALGNLNGVTGEITGGGFLKFEGSDGDSFTVGGSLPGPILGVAKQTYEADTTTTTTPPNPRRNELRQTYNDLLGQIDALARDSSFNGVNLLNGDDLSVLFNEDGSSSIAIKGVTNDAHGLGLDELTATDAFDDNDDVNAVLDDLKTAIDKLRGDSAKFGSNLSVVETRQDFTSQMINVLQTGAANLTLADTNEEAANVLALQTRQQLSSTALSLASQADQNVLRLF